MTRLKAEEAAGLCIFGKVNGMLADGHSTSRLVAGRRDDAVWEILYGIWGLIQDGRRHDARNSNSDN